MKKLVFALALAFGAVSIGCTPSPEKVCNHLVDILEKEMGDKKKDKDKDDKDERKKFVDDCVKKAEKEKSEDPDNYKCSAKCAMDVKDLDGLKSCDDKCPSKKKKDKDKSSDDDDKDSKKKKKDKDE